MISVKAQFNEEFKRFEIDENLKFIELETILRDLFGLNEINRIRICYKDEEGDKIRIDQEKEFQQHKFEVKLSGRSLLRLIVEVAPSGIPLHGEEISLEAATLLMSKPEMQDHIYRVVEKLMSSQSFQEFADRITPEVAKIVRDDVRSSETLRKNQENCFPHKEFSPYASVLFSSVMVDEYEKGQTQPKKQPALDSTRQANKIETATPGSEQKQENIKNEKEIVAKQTPKAEDPQTEDFIFIDAGKYKFICQENMESLILDGALPASIDEASSILSNGGLVCLPTETVYGLGADCMNSAAVSNIFHVKGRPRDNPLIVHVDSLEAVAPPLIPTSYKIPENLLTMMRDLWPGPLTIVFPKGEAVPIEITGAREPSSDLSIAIRVPAHKIAIELLRCSRNKGVAGVAAPSANRSGRPSPTTAQEVELELRQPLEELKSKGTKCCILNGGKCHVGVESTVLHPCFGPAGNVPAILRPGGITIEKIKEYLPNVVHYNAEKHQLDSNTPPPTPGMKYRHYAPSCKVVIVYTKPEAPDQSQDSIDELIEGQFELERSNSHGKIAVVKLSDQVTDDQEVFVKEREKENRVDIIIRSGLEGMARNLFSVLREAETRNADICIVQGVQEEGIGKAIMNRLTKAAAGGIVV